MINKTAIWIIGLMSAAGLGAQPNPVRLSTAETVFGIVNPGPYGASPLVAAVGDFNNDGIPDMVTIDNGNPSAVALLLGHGDGDICVTDTGDLAGKQSALGGGSRFQQRRQSGFCVSGQLIRYGRGGDRTG